MARNPEEKNAELREDLKSLAHNVDKLLVKFQWKHGFAPDIHVNIGIDRIGQSRPEVLAVRASVNFDEGQ